MRVSVKADAESLQRALTAFPGEMQRALRIGMIDGLEQVQAQAKTFHRFKRKTGTLQRSIEKSVSSSGLSGEVYLDEALASYGQYVHEGHGTWAPDQFLYEAADAKQGAVSAELSKAVDMALKRLGLA